jgi:hypothetical protein
MGAAVALATRPLGFEVGQEAGTNSRSTLPSVVRGVRKTGHMRDTNRFAFPVGQMTHDVKIKDGHGLKLKKGVTSVEQQGNCTN